jgi:hypothetical protein
MSHSHNLSPRTIAIRELLEKHKGELTWSQAKPMLESMKIKCGANTFGIIKYEWKKKVSKEEASKSKVTSSNAIDYVTSLGGLTKAEEDLVRRETLIQEFKTLLNRMKELA